ncbi:putative molybdopterin biosynthesis protein [Sporobacter termitidis DSM 10068]|uniref:Molybdopterin molybdenumtransferase n=1 Tax=Sporobacter termitidis DSM 10068 TaxID=1123282 RepID=A0A1M5XCC1_9FIRM|nr:molybdopterin molybdotransferase MoeA [Sporobacter termitidis]SHH97461.1 putative molybdopterin biosynthesis protein [Sporobacter termitidis DSM 10068]
MKIKSCQTTCGTCTVRCHRQMSKLPTKAEALEILFREVKAQRKTETVALKNALHRVTAEDIYAKWNVPNADRAMHDGIAIAWDLAAEKQARGENFLHDGEYLRLAMGEIIPEKFDTFLPWELCGYQDDQSVSIAALPKKGEGVTRCGANVRQGELIVRAKRRLEPSHLAILRLSGVEQAVVFKKPRVAILPVGDDLQKPGLTPLPGQSMEADSIMVESVAQLCGCETAVEEPIADRPEAIREAIQRHAGAADILILIGGLGQEGSVYGDHSAEAVRALGRILVHGAAIGPGGKPTLLGTIDGKYVLGIPGPPHAAMMVTEQFLPPIIEQFLCVPCFERAEVDAVLGEGFKPRGSSVYMPRVNLRWTGSGYELKSLRMGDTVDCFVNGTATIELGPSAAPRGKGETVKARLVYGERTIRQLDADQY